MTCSIYASTRKTRKVSRIYSSFFLGNSVSLVRHSVRYNPKTLVGKFATTFECFPSVVPSSLKSFTHFSGNVSRKKSSILP